MHAGDANLISICFPLNIIHLDRLIYMTDECTLLSKIKITSKTKIDLIGDGMKIEGILKFSASIISIVLNGSRINFPLEERTAITSSDHQPPSTIVSHAPSSGIYKQANGEIL